MNAAYNMRPIPGLHKQRRNYLAIALPLAIVLLVLGSYVGYALLRPLPAPKTVAYPPIIAAQVTVNIPWPASGQAAFGAQGYGLLASHNIDKPVPTASVAKVITALAVLQKKPLKLGEAGPSLTMSAQDVALYQKYAANDGSVVPIYEGQKISEYQALQAMMLPSANNISDTLAIWAFGSLDAYRTFAIGYVHDLSMNQTTIGSDASGFSPTTTSTASDLIRLGIAALDNPVLAQIVAQSEATFPDYGTISNVNTLLGTDGIRGIKTGNTEEAGGCYLAAADITVAGQKITVVTAIMSAANRPVAMRDSQPLIRAAVSEFQQTSVVTAGQKLGQIVTPWGSTSDVVATQPISVLSYAGSALVPTVSTKPAPRAAPAHTPVGSVQLTYSGKTYSSGMETTAAINTPDMWWRLKHPL